MIYGERVRVARELVGLTQAELGDRIDAKQGSVAQIEKGLFQPSEDLVHRIAVVTGFPPSFFRQPIQNDLPIGSLLYRARRSVTMRDKARARRLAQLYFESAIELRSRLVVPDVTLPRLREDPITSAQITRSALGLSPDGPIKNLVASLEKAGVVVLSLPFEFKGIDAFSSWPGDLESPPFIALTKTLQGDRLRFSTAHEVGELVLHQQPLGSVSEMDDRANAFASELLMPADTMHNEISTPVTIGSLAELKPHWGVSIQALIRRARDLSIITERQYRYLFEQLSSKGWRTREPDNLLVKSEVPRAIGKMVELLYGVSFDVGAIAADLHRSEAFIRRMLEAHSLRATDINTDSPKLLRFRDRSERSS